MKKAFSYNIKKFPGFGFAVIAILLISLASCPVKNLLKSVAFFPSQTEHSATQKTSLYASDHFETCTKCQAEEMIVTKEVSPRVIELMPGGPSVAIELFSFERAFYHPEKILPLFPKIQNTGATPIFLQTGKLVI